MTDERTGESGQRASRSLPGPDALLLAAVILSAAYLPPIGVTAVCSLYFMLYILKRGGRVKRALLTLLLVPAALFAIGVSGLLRNDTMDAVKDGWYFMNPMVVLAAGFAAGDGGLGLRRLLRVLVVCAVIASLVHIFYMLVSANTALLTLPVNQIRMQYGRGTFLPVLGAFITISCMRRGVPLFGRGRKAGYPALGLCLAALLLSFSRTFWISLAVLLMFDALSFRKALRSAAALAAAAAAALLLVYVLSVYYEGRSGSTLLGKSAQSIEEVAPSDYSGMRDISIHWRGYETFMSLLTYKAGSDLEKALGFGFGKLVDLGIYVNLGGETMRYVPVMHNGYVFVLLKTGAAGLALYVVYLAALMVRGVRETRRRQGASGAPARALAGISAVFLSVAFVTVGFYSKSAMVVPLVFLGAMYASVSRRDELPAWRC